jgi:hypothetical protein
MVSSKALRDLRNSYETSSQGPMLEPSRYVGRWYDVVFEIITTDSYVAGIASKVLDGCSVAPEERALVSSSLLDGGHLWRLSNGQVTDLTEKPEILQLAVRIEKLRRTCNRVLLSESN